MRTTKAIAIGMVLGVIVTLVIHAIVGIVRYTIGG